VRDAYRRILQACLATNPTTDFPVEVFSEELSAAAAAFWVRSDLDENEIVLSKSINRPDLEDRQDRVSFYLTNSFVARFLESSHTDVISASIDELREMPWDNEHLKRYAEENFMGAIFISFKDADSLRAMLSLYYDSERPELIEPDFSHLRLFISTYLNTMSKELRSIMVERRKIGHEIARMISQASSKVATFNNKISKNSSLRQPLSDVQKALAAAREAASNKTFIEGVYDRKAHSRPLSLRTELLTAFHLALAKYNKRFTMITQINISYTAKIWFAEEDLGLLFSNIAANAVKYTVAGGAISIVFSISDKGSTLTISNLSKPMSASELERVWRFGVRGGNADGLDGEGIGLSIVNDICYAYGARAKLSQRRSGRNVWTDLTLSFPPKMCSDRRIQRGVT